MADPKTTEICPHCMGSGESGPDQKCWTCNGSGGVPKTTAPLDEGDETWGRLQTAFRWVKAATEARKVAVAELNRLHLLRYGYPYEGGDL